MTTSDPKPTHTAYAFSRQGKKFGKLLECGKGRIDKAANLVHVFMDRGPLIGYTGYIVLAPAGAPPPTVEPPPIEDEDDEGFGEFED